jgi:hypothetical protein
MRRRRWWAVPVNVTATVAGRLPGALLGAVLFVAAGSMLGPVGFLVALVWLVAGALTVFRFGERAVARIVLRYRPASGSWLEVEARRLLPGSRVDVYVAPRPPGCSPWAGAPSGSASCRWGTAPQRRRC